MAFDQSAFKAQLESIGEERVREVLTTGAMSDPKKVPLAREFLRQKDQARSDALEHRKDASIREQIDIERSAKNAAWAAAIAAIIAAICATISIAVTLY